MIVCTLLALAAASSAQASPEIGQDRPFGAGLAFGDPNGLSGKMYLGGPHAADVALAWDTWGWGGVYAHGTYLIRPTVLHSDNSVDISWHFGAGGYVISGATRGRYAATMAVGARGPLGLDFDLWDIPLQIFCEIAAEVQVLPQVDLGLGLGLGARYYF